MMKSHGVAVAGSSLENTVYIVEEIEETAKLFFLLHGRPTQVLTPEQAAELRKRFPAN